MDLEFEDDCSICAGTGKTSGQPCVCTLASQVHPKMARASQPSAEPAPASSTIETWKHVANEWADMATNALVWLSNIEEGISTVAAARENMEKCLLHCQEVSAAARTSAEPEPAAQIVDERAQFEQTEPGADFSRAWAFGSSSEDYANPHLQNRWVGWNRRAAIDTAPAAPAVADHQQER